MDWNLGQWLQVDKACNWTCTKGWRLAQIIVAVSIIHGILWSVLKHGCFMHHSLKSPLTLTWSTPRASNQRSLTFIFLPQSMGAGVQERTCVHMRRKPTQMERRPSQAKRKPTQAKRGDVRFQVLCSQVRTDAPYLKQV